ncbi:CNNM domain-containing protein [Pelagibaculum spongiae]|uniref:Hemolysin n=1 Tax=Pelagibaculum spongiae TaxID=2080658 RepID=A0A2V1GXD3_9GAMM|nr:hemolysin family protein [Pelagibaculum spongiae]PVZ65693.1 hemolysin [Pelagibaculum spongiae]
MLLLIIYILIALGFSFLCSVLEAVLLSISDGYIAAEVKNNSPAGKRWKHLKAEINRPLAAILTLNTVAHTLGAAGAGAQAAVVFGSDAVGIASAILTLLILVFSEIIPKTLGAVYWRALAPASSLALIVMTRLLHPFVIMSEKITRSISSKEHQKGFNRQELAAVAELSAQEGHIDLRESQLVKNLFGLQKATVADAMTPRNVLFSLSEQLTVIEYIGQYRQKKFSRIPIYKDRPEQITGYVLRSEILQSFADNQPKLTLSELVRPLKTVPDTLKLPDAFEDSLKKKLHIALVIDEYGDIKGVITLEDLIETLLGMEIVDEHDQAQDMQQLARRLWRKRARTMGIEIERA